MGCGGGLRELAHDDEVVVTSVAIDRKGHGVGARW